MATSRPRKVKRSAQKPAPLAAVLVGVMLAVTLVSWKKRAMPVGSMPYTDAAYRLDLNAAARDEFQMLPGVGPVMAARIVSHRHEFGGFANVEELDHIHGVGLRTLERIRPWIVVRQQVMTGIAGE